MSKAKKIPYGMTDLETIIREGYYYVDKTRFIPRLEEEGRYVIFLRPRRYGKSLTIAMLQYYYGIQYAGKFDDIFGGLEIGKNPTDKRNSYLVLSLNFSNVDSDKDKVEESFNSLLLLELKSFASTYKDYLPERNHRSSRAEDSHLHPLTEPCVKVSPHTALHIQRDVQRQTLGV